MAFFCSICNLGEVSIPDRVTYRRQVLGKIQVFDLWDQRISGVKFGGRNELACTRRPK